ncbi:MAG: TRAP transporter small permease, partial [Beijerinckiaceae bacterium]
MVVLVFLPLAYVQKKDGHFVAGIFTDNLPAPALRILTGISDLAMFAVTALIAWSAVSAAVHATHSGEQVQMAEFLLPAWPGRWLVPLGMGMMSLYALLNAITKLVPGLARAGDRN